MSDNNSNSGIVKPLVTLAIIVVTAIFIIAKIGMQSLGYVLIVALGFGFVIMIHEFGHFIVARASGIKCQAFSIGFPPTLLGIRKTNKGIRFRLLPSMMTREATEEELAFDPDEIPGGINFTIKCKCKPSDTEYRFGLIPFGGFVKMLGQEDSGVVERSDDPRSFANKSVMPRIAVVAAGVIFNAISAIAIFMTVFLIGLEMSPAVVGGVIPNSPAQIAGLQPGDRIIEVNGETFVDFMYMPMTSALSAKGEPINLVVRHTDGSEESYDIVPEMAAESPIPVRSFGIEQPSTLKIENFKDPKIIDLILGDSGLMPNDKITAVNGIDVETAWQLNDIVKRSLKPTAKLTVERTFPEGSDPRLVDVEMPLLIDTNTRDFNEGRKLSHVFSLVPRLKILSVVDRSKTNGWKSKTKLWWRKTALSQKIEPPQLKPGDIIVKVADIDNPTFTELRTVTVEHKDKEMPMTVIRKDIKGNEQITDVVVIPRQEFTRRGDGPVNIGIFPVLDAEHAVIAETIEGDNTPAAIDIPRGATITSVNGNAVKTFYDVAAQIKTAMGKETTISYTTADGQPGSTMVTINDPEHINARSVFADTIPLTPLKEIYKAKNPGQAVVMGCKKTYMFIAQTYVTLKRLITRDVDPTTLSGPLGIVTMSYQIASNSLIYYLYFLGLLSSCIAVMNLLPLPVVDGGVIVMLIIEKIKGSPISEKVQAIVSYSGLVLILTLFAWLLYNDFLNMTLSP